MNRHNIFLFITSHSDVFKKKFEVRFSIRDPPAKPGEQKKQVALGNSLRLHTWKVRPRPRKQSYNYFTKTFFSSKFLILSTDVPWRKSPLDGATDCLYGDLLGL